MSAAPHVCDRFWRFLHPILRDTVSGLGRVSLFLQLTAAGLCFQKYLKALDWNSVSMQSRQECEGALHDSLPELNNAHIVNGRDGERGEKGGCKVRDSCMC